MPVSAATNPTATGESGTNGSGGGGGVVGGVAGEAVLHYHNDSCYGTRELSRTASNKHNDYRDNDEDLIHKKVGIYGITQFQAMKPLDIYIYNKQPYETHANVDWDSNGNDYIESTD